MIKPVKPVKSSVRNAFSGYAFISPWIIGFFVLTLYPLIYAIRLSVNSVEIRPGGTVFNWVGKEFFIYALKVDTNFTIDLGKTAMLICCASPVVIVFSLIIAIMLNGNFRGRTFFRTVYFMPVVIMSGPVISELLTEHTIVFDTDSQIVSFLKSMPSFIQTPSLFILENLVLILWFSGVQILVFLAGLQKIPYSVYEAASIDGAGAWEKFWKITLPYITPLALICSVYTVIDISSYSGNAVNGDITAHLFDTTRLYSLSAAMAWIYFGMIMLILLVVYMLFFIAGRRKN